LKYKVKGKKKELQEDGENILGGED
jgi:hypothetical protein